MPTPMDEFKMLMKYSTKHADDTMAKPWKDGYDAGHCGVPGSENPHELTPLTGARGLPKRTMSGEAEYRRPSRSRLSWFDGWEEGNAAREGRLLDLMRARRAAATGDGQP